MNWNRIKDISVLRTLRFNIKYFGFSSLKKMPVVVSKYVRLSAMNGTIDLDWKNMHTGCIRIGFPIVGIFDKRLEKTIWDNNGVVEFKGTAFIGCGTRIANMGKLVFGENTSITANTSIICKQNINIGNDCLFSWDILIMDTDFHNISDKNGNVINEDRAINIEDHCWVGCRSTVLKGASIPKNSVIAAGSIVSTKMNEENAIYKSFGEVLRSEISWRV